MIMNEMIQLVGQISHKAHSEYYPQIEAQKDYEELRWYRGEVLGQPCLDQISLLAKTLDEFANTRVTKQILANIANETLIQLSARMTEMYLYAYYHQ